MIRLHSKGTGPAVLLIHASVMDPNYFDPLVEVLSKHRRVLVVDLPGYKGLPGVSGPDRFLQTHQLIEHELLRQNVRELAVIGFSGGAYRAVALATSSALRVTHLMSIGGFAQLDSNARMGSRQLAEQIRRNIDARAILPGILLRPDFLEQHPEVGEEIAAWTEIVSREYFAAEMDSFADSPDYSAAFAALDIPITARSGELDARMPPQWTQAMKELNPRVEVQIVPGCGHALLFEDRDATIAAALRAVGVQ